MPDRDADAFAARVRAAQADAWQVQGRLRASLGGGALELHGIRLMASGLPHPQWNNGDVTAPDADVEGARAFFAERGVPWGVRVPTEMPWSHGQRLFRKRLMGVRAEDFVPAPTVPGLDIREAGIDDLDAVVRVSAVGFEEDPELERPWAAPHLGAEEITVALATRDGMPIATGHAVHSDDWAGPAVAVGGIAVVEAARRRGVGAAIASWLTARGLARDAELAHLHPDHDAAARVYARLGFVETPGLDIYVDL